MSEIETLVENSIRPKLDDETKKRCHDIVDELFALYEETDPEKGLSSEKGKNKKAIDALMKIGNLTETLTEWAEDHVIGLYYRKSKYKNHEMPEKDFDLHDNERVQYEEAVFYTGCSCGLCDSCYKSSLKLTREALNKILHYTSGIYGGTKGWRWMLREALCALNNGQIKWILQIINTQKNNNAFDLQELKISAIKHVYRLVGEGYQKYSARGYIMEKYKINSESLRKWEYALIKEKIIDKNQLERIEEAARFLYVNKSLDTPSNYEDIYSLAIYSIAIKEPTTNDTEGVLYIKNRNYTFPKTIQDKTIYPERLALGILACSALEANFPLHSLYERLLDAGL